MTEPKPTETRGPGGTDSETTLQPTATGCHRPPSTPPCEWDTRTRHALAAAQLWGFPGAPTHHTGASTQQFFLHYKPHPWQMSQDKGLRQASPPYTQQANLHDRRPRGRPQDRTELCAARGWGGGAGAAAQALGEGSRGAQAWPLRHWGGRATLRPELLCAPGLSFLSRKV